MHLHTPFRFRRRRSLLRRRRIFLAAASLMGLARSFSAWNSVSAINSMVGQALAEDALDRALGARLVVHPQCNASVVAELELREAAMPVLLAAVLVDAIHSALENAERAFDPVRVHRAAHVFVDRVPDRFVAHHLATCLDIEPALIGRQRRLSGDVLADDPADRGLRRARHASA